jgi:hypothetical protein
MVVALLTILLSTTPEVSSTSSGPLVPWFVPRSASIGLFVNSPVVSPHVRLAWEAAIISQPRNDFIWTAVLGTGLAATPQRPMSSHYQHVFLLGLGYRSDHTQLHWGFHIAPGVVWYRAAYLPGSDYRFEDRVIGYLEGRLQLGLKVAPHLRVAAYVGFASPFTFKQELPGNTFVGGVDFGIVVDWR